jgi:hypothetical protein
MSYISNTIPQTSENNVEYNIGTINQTLSQTLIKLLQCLVRKDLLASCIQKCKRTDPAVYMNAVRHTNEWRRFQRCEN